ncbi:MAG TPA: nickel pincer cofactor biosynthesis protein LarC [Candidatus Bathyarchaeia archaeon]|nr:nickel pincer cofactor biosynthesis protein LarC [Candidatus Bathyarchaeia archaeon]
MPQITVIDPSIAGISGDMLLGGLIDAGGDVETIREILQLIPKHFPRCKSINLETKHVWSHGFKASCIEFKISEGDDEIQIGKMLQAAKDMTKEAKLSKRAVDFALGSVNLLINAESKVHGTNFSNTHLHEAGSADTLADIFGVAAACDSLKLFDGEIFSTPVAIGGGSVTFSHGTLAVPAPAVMEILTMHHIPMKGGPETVELTTPTGIAMLANLAHIFSPIYPEMIPDKVGYGAGRRQLISSPNLLRIVLGSREGSIMNEVIDMLETNLDDVSGEVLAHTLQRLIDSGAKDAWLTAAQFKKNRPGNVLHVLCKVQDTEKFSRMIMEETGTLGIRHQRWDRFILDRGFKTLNIEIAGRRFEVRVKLARDTAGNLIRAKPEFDDIGSISKAVSMPARYIEQIVSREIERLVMSEREHLA